MFDLLTLEEEARRRGVRLLRSCVQRSGARYELECDVNGRLCIRRPLRVISQLSAEQAANVIWERLTAGPFVSVEDLYCRVKLDHDQFRALAVAGALDQLTADRRRAVWEIGVLEQRHGTPGQRTSARLFGGRVIAEEFLPQLPRLQSSEQLSWDLQSTGSSDIHPVAAARSTLTALCVSSIAGLQSQEKGVVRVAGRVTMRQRPPTAKGVLFITLEDETGIVQAIVYPGRIPRMREALRASALVVSGEMQAQGRWRALVIDDAWPLPDILGGYSGHLQMGGGRDSFVSAAVA